MSDKTICSSIEPVQDSGCSHVSKGIKTVFIDEADFDKNKAVLEEALKMGTPIIINAGDLSPAGLIAGGAKLMEGALLSAYLPPPPKPILLFDHPKIDPVTMPDNDVVIPITPGLTKINLDNRQLQGKGLEAANIPDDIKQKIAAEYWRLCKLHPAWKAHRAMRKAGEKFNIKFEFE